METSQTQTHFIRRNLVALLYNCLSYLEIYLVGVFFFVYGGKKRSICSVSSVELPLCIDDDTQILID